MLLVRSIRRCRRASLSSPCITAARNAGGTPLHWTDEAGAESASPTPGRMDLEEVELLLGFPHQFDPAAQTKTLLQSPDDRRLRRTVSERTVETASGATQQHVAQLKQNDFRRRERLEVRNRRREVGIAQAALQVAQTHTITRCLQVEENAVFVEIHDPATQEMVVEPVETRFPVVSVAREFGILPVHGNAAEPHVHAERNEQVDKLLVEGLLRRRYLRPLHLAPDAVPHAQSGDPVLGPATHPCRQPKASNHEVASPWPPGGEEVGQGFVAIDFELQVSASTNGTWGHATDGLIACESRRLASTAISVASGSNA